MIITNSALRASLVIYLTIILRNRAEYLTIILRGRAGYRMIDNQRGALSAELVIII